MIDLSQWRASIGLWNNCRSTTLDEINPSKNKMVSTSEGKKGELEGEIQLIDDPLLTTGQPLLWGYCKSDTCTCVDTCDDSGGVWPTVTCLCLEICLLIVLWSSLLLHLCGDVELNPGPGKPHELLRSNSDKLIDAITPVLTRVINGLYAKGLIPQATKNDLQTIMGLSDYDKASRLMTVIQQQLESSSDPDQYIMDTCHVLINQHYQSLTDFATSFLHDLGQPVPNISPVITPVLPQSTDIQAPTATNSYGIGQMFRSIANRGGLTINVQQYISIMKEQYKDQPIVASDWPPKIGKDFFGRLTLAEKYFCQDTATWYSYKDITINNLIELNDEPSSPLRVVIDGPPGIGKTTLCRKLCNMWAKGTLTQYDLVLYCPLRNSKIAQATTLTDLFVYKCTEVQTVTKWIEQSHGERLLIIFDGWDELSTELRHSSLATSIIRKERLAKCSVIVTSRSYASSSLLKLDSTIKHVQVMGFSNKEIATVVRATLEDQELADNLIIDIKIREDIQSLCYIPLVCSMVIFVYRKLRGRLPTTLTELYENFILQTIKRHVERTPGSSIGAEDISNLDNLPQALTTPLLDICEFAYMNLRDNKMTFFFHQLQQHFQNSDLIKEGYFGLISSFTDHGDNFYHFLHLSFQEFLAAWWIVKCDNMKTEEVFKEHFYNDHFRMCLRFVAGLTHLKPEKNYTQYFDQPFDLQCKRKPLFGFEDSYSIWIHRTAIKIQLPMLYSYRTHLHLSNAYKSKIILLLHLLYESQNINLCQVLADNIVDGSLCRHKVEVLSLFNMLCLKFFMNNSKTVWNHLDLGDLGGSNTKHALILLDEQRKIFKKLETNISLPNDLLFSQLKEFVSSDLVEEFHCTLNGKCELDALLMMLELRQLKVLNLVMPFEFNVQPIILSKFASILQNHNHLEELHIYTIDRVESSQFIQCVISGVAHNKTIKHLSLCKGSDTAQFTLADGIIEQLLNYNHTLQSLVLSIPFELSRNSTIKTTPPVTALFTLNLELAFHFNNLSCLSVIDLSAFFDQYSLSRLFDSQPNLQHLELILTTIEQVSKLATLIKSNTSLKSLNLFTLPHVLDCDLSCLCDMLKHNKALTIFGLEVDNSPHFHLQSSSYLVYLTEGLKDNTTIQKLNVPIPLLSNQHFESFLTIVLQKEYLTELQITFILPDLASIIQNGYQNLEREQFLVLPSYLFYKQGLQTVYDFLLSHLTIKMLKIKCEYVDNLSPSLDWNNGSWTENKLWSFYLSVFRHPSLEYVELEIPFPKIPYTIYKYYEARLLEEQTKTQPNRNQPPVFNIVV